MSDAWIQTFSNLKFDILDPNPEQVSIADIAHGLSQLCRFTGQCKQFYSIAQHSYLGSFLVPPKDALSFLMHDSSEAFIADLSRPLKHFTSVGKEYLPIEKKVMEVICKRFGLPVVQPKSVHDVDNEMLYAEKAQLMPSMLWEHTWADSTAAADVKIEKMTPEEAEDKFLNRFFNLI